MSKTFTVAVYDEALAYGGPQEGGWWYDVGSLVRVMRVFKSEAKAIAYTYRLNTKLQSSLKSWDHERPGFGPNAGRYRKSDSISDGEYVALNFEGTAPTHYPEARPMYE
jgi:hypothetical protein